MISRSLAALVLLVLLGGCYRVGPGEPCRVVRVEGGDTYVEFPDGTRRRRPGMWAELGEEITAAREDGYGLTPGVRPGIFWTTPRVVEDRSFARGVGVALGSLVLFLGGWFARDARK